MGMPYRVCVEREKVYRVPPKKETQQIRSLNLIQAETQKRISMIIIIIRIRIRRE